MQPVRHLHVSVNGARRHQTIDGWGVNINSKDWRDGKLVPVMERLIDDLGCTLFRQDAFGNSNWVDPGDDLSAACLTPAHYRKVYAGPDFRAAAGMATYLNGRGIEPYLCLSGVIPRWMCAKDGRTMRDYAAFAEMAASYAHWARATAGIRFTLFGPLNETDIGPPEGPYVGPAEYVKAAEAMVGALNRHGLKDVQLVVPETASMNIEYLRPLVRSRKLLGRIAVVGLHTYGDFHPQPLMELVAKSPYKSARWWMTEYGDLDQTGEREWFVAWVAYERLLKLLRMGFHAALNWDAYDNYHDHDQSWSIYGLLRRGVKMDTPKKRYWAVRQMYRWVRPGWSRIGAESPDSRLPVLAFANPDATHVTVTGMNEADHDVLLNVNLEGIDRTRLPRTADVHRTTEELDCALVATVPVTSPNWPYSGIAITAPARSIFTATTYRPPEVLR